MPCAFKSASNALAASTEELYVKATLAPCCAKTSAIPLPIPRLAPVMIAVFPSSSFIIMLVSFCHIERSRNALNLKA